MREILCEVHALLYFLKYSVKVLAVFGVGYSSSRGQNFLKCLDIFSYEIHNTDCKDIGLVLLAD